MTSYQLSCGAIHTLFMEALSKQTFITLGISKGIQEIEGN